jgi:hypothetical protein
MIRSRPLLPLVRRAKPKTKTFLRRETQNQVGGSACLPLVGPEPFKNYQKGDPSLVQPPADFQAHPSMRIC